MTSEYFFIISKKFVQILFFAETGLSFSFFFLSFDSKTIAQKLLTNIGERCYKKKTELEQLVVEFIFL